MQGTVRWENEDLTLILRKKMETFADTSLFSWFFFLIFLAT
jgi:hypothetical protein